MSEFSNQKDNVSFEEGFAEYVVRNFSAKVVRTIAEVIGDANRFQKGDETAREILMSRGSVGEAVIKAFELYSQKGPSFNLDAANSALHMQGMSEAIVKHLRS